MHVNRRSSDIGKRYRKYFGFATSGSGATSRAELYSDTLTTAMQRSCTKMRDKTLIDQALSLIVKDGRVDHPRGQHDDMVIGWLLCHWLMTKATNLQFYGIDSRCILSKAMPQKVLSIAEQRELREQQQIKSQMEEHYKRLQNESDENICMRLEHMLKSLSMRLTSQEEDAVSIDELIRQARETRRERKRAGLYNRGQSIHQQLGYANGAHQGEFSDRPMSANEIYRRRYG
jgi:hypothetical protein